MTTALPQAITREILAETMQHFGYGSAREAATHLNDPEFKQHQNQLKGEKLHQLGLLKEKYPQATDQAINLQLTEKSGEYYHYWQNLPGIIADEETRLSSFVISLDNVQDLGWIVKYRQVFKSGQYLAGAMALYYLRHERIIGAIHVVATGILYMFSHDLSVIEKSCEGFNDVKVEQTSSKMLEGTGKVFQEIKKSGYFLSYFIEEVEEAKKEEVTAKTLLNKFSDISQAIYWKLEVNAESNEGQIKAIFQDVSALVRKIEWGAYAWILAGTLLAFYAYMRGAYLAACVGTGYVGVASKIGLELRAVQTVYLNIANAESGKVSEVYNRSKPAARAISSAPHSGDSG